MKTKALIVNAVLFLLLANATSSVAQNVSGSAPDWHAVKTLATGDRLSVRLKDGKKVEGTVSSASDTLLVLNRRNRTDNLNRDAIAKVYRIVPRSAARSIGKSTAMGAGIGFGAGAGVGIWGGSYEDLETAGLVGILGGFGAAIGAGIGALVGAVYVKPRKVLVYEFK
jgi:hypothetical protein